MTDRANIEASLKKKAMRDVGRVVTATLDAVDVLKERERAKRVEERTRQRELDEQARAELVKKSPIELLQEDAIRRQELEGPSRQSVAKREDAEDALTSVSTPELQRLLNAALARLEDNADQEDIALAHRLNSILVGRIQKRNVPVDADASIGGYVYKDMTEFNRLAQRKQEYAPVFVALALFAKSKEYKALNREVRKVEGLIRDAEYIGDTVPIALKKQLAEAQTNLDTARRTFLENKGVSLHRVDEWLSSKWLNKVSAGIQNHMNQLKKADEKSGKDTLGNFVSACRQVGVPQLLVFTRSQRLVEKVLGKTAPGQYKTGCLEAGIPMFWPPRSESHIKVAVKTFTTGTKRFLTAPAKVRAFTWAEVRDRAGEPVVGNVNWDELGKEGLALVYEITAVDR